MVLTAQNLTVCMANVRDIRNQSYKHFVIAKQINNKQMLIYLDKAIESAYIYIKKTPN